MSIFKIIERKETTVETEIEAKTAGEAMMNYRNHARKEKSLISQKMLSENIKTIVSEEGKNK
ncbi:hypothetical protein HXA35_20585 [Bacillus sp. A301a_S52]|nr:hypothetical protein [Bacillus sp. A301a_S52]